MSREIVTANDIRRMKDSGTSPALPSKDSYFDRLFKYIPAELVAGYIFIAGTVKQLTDQSAAMLVHWIIFPTFCILTPLYLWRVQKVKKVQQLIISTLSFIVWVFALGGPFALYDWYNPVYGAILLPVFTIVIAIWEAE
ncbi:MAG: hypothetical protein HPY62_04360 [Bacteroidales bacterium]|nr:hypothetical protein [Bacteroidales bacterium]